MTTTYFPARRVATPPRLSEMQKRWILLGLFAAFVLLTALYPDLAFAQDAKSRVAAAGQKTYDLVFQVIYWGSAIALTVCGLAWGFGRMELQRFLQIAAGITLAFAATAFVDYFKS